MAIRTITQGLRQFVVWGSTLSLCLLPFVFTWINDELFEFNKMLFVYGVVSVLAAAWAVRVLLEGKWSWRRTPFDVVIGLWLVSQLISTLFSIHPHTSIFGYYSRLHGGLLSSIAYAVWFWIITQHYTPSDVWKLLKLMMGSLAGVVLFALPEHFGKGATCLLINTSREWPGTMAPFLLWENWATNCWVQDVQNRIFGTFGQPNWLAAYLVTVLPIATLMSGYGWWRWSALSTRVQRQGQIKIVLMSTLTVATWLTLLYTKSRSGLLAGLAGVGWAGLGVGVWQYLQHGRAVMDHLKKRMPVSFLAGGTVVTLAVIASTLFYSSPLTELFQTWGAPSTSTPAVAPAPSAELGGTDSGVIRTIVWKGALAVFLRYPLFGSGVETFAFSYYRDRPIEHNVVSEWDFLYNKAHNEFLNILANTGIVGLGVYVAFLSMAIGWPLWQLWQQPSKRSSVAIITGIGTSAGLIALSISNFFGFSTVAVGALLFVLPALSVVVLAPVALPKTPEKIIVSGWRWAAIVTVCLIGASCLSSILQMWSADILFVRGKAAIQQGDVVAGVGSLERAIHLSPRQSFFTEEAATGYGWLALAVNDRQDATLSAELADTAMDLSRQTLELNPVHLPHYKLRARLLMTLTELRPLALDDAVTTLKAGWTLAPTDPVFPYTLATIAEARGQNEEALKLFSTTIELKPNYEEARMNYAQLLETTGATEAAATQYRYILEHIQPLNQIARQKVGSAAATPTSLPE
jgi:putative inorganic carbon (hco3(-)) transporter